MATVIQRQNPLAALLEPISRIFQTKLQTQIADQERSKQLEERILQESISNPDISRFLASAEAEPFLAKMGLDKSPHIRALVDRGRAANASIEAPTTAGIGQDQVGSVAGLGKIGVTPEQRNLGPTLVNIPRGPATSREVSNAVSGEQAQRQLGIKQAELEMENANKLLYSYQEQMMKDGLKLSPQESQALAEKVLKTMKAGSRMAVKIDESGFPSITLTEPDPNEAPTRLRTNLLNKNDYWRGITDLQDARAKAAKDTLSILQGEIQSVLPFDQASGSDLQQKMNRDWMTGFLTTPNKEKLRKMSRGQQVETYLKFFNKSIETANKVNADRGKLVGMDPERIIEDQMPTISFEEVVGKPRAEWEADQVKDPALNPGRPDAGGQKVPGPTVPGSAGKAKSSEVKIMDAYKSAAERISKVKAANGGALSRDDLGRALLENKAGIMAQFGLNAEEYAAFEKLIKDAVK